MYYKGHCRLQVITRDIWDFFSSKVSVVEHTCLSVGQYRHELVTAVIHLAPEGGVMLFHPWLPGDPSSLDSQPRVWIEKLA